MPTKKTFLINASLLKESDCDYKVHLIHNRGFTSQDATFKMDYGTAIHKFIAAYLRGVPYTEAKQLALEYYLLKCASVPTDDFRTIDHLFKTITAYQEAYPRATDLIKPLMVTNPDGKVEPVVEMNFAWPYYQDSEVEVILCGTIDLLGEFCGRKVIVDHKTTSTWNKQSYLEAYELSNQLKFYSWFLKLSGYSEYHLPGIINGIFIKNPTFKTKDKTTGKLVQVAGFTGVSFQRSPLIEFSLEAMDKFSLWVERRIEKIISNYKSGVHEENHNRCETVYGSCQFAKVCRLDDRHREEVFKTLFEVREYNPLAFQE